MSSSLLPSAEWISTAARRAAATTPNASSGSSSSAGRCRQHPPTSSTDDTNSPHQHSGAGGAGPAGSNDREQRDEEVVGHRGSGGLVRGRAVFCLPPEVEWFQGHFAYTAVGGCSASLGILGTELDVDAVRKNYRSLGLYLDHEQRTQYTHFPPIRSTRYVILRMYSSSSTIRVARYVSGL